MNTGGSFDFRDAAPIPASSISGAGEINPYAAPSEASYLPPPLPAADPNALAGLWRQGNVLVMHREAPLPEICLKTNLPATRRLKRALTWHHPAIYLLVLLHIFLYAVVALIVRKKATIHIPLCEERYARRHRDMVIAWATVLLSFALFGMGLYYVDQPGSSLVFLLALAPFLFLGGLLYGHYTCRMIVCQRISGDYVWIKGVHPEFLQRLEPWQWNL